MMSMETADNQIITRLEETLDRKASSFKHMDDLQLQIDRYEKNVALLEGRLQPVLSRHGAVRGIDPDSPTAEHQLQEQVFRLESANEALETIIAQVAL